MNGDQNAKAAKDSLVVQSQRDTNIGYSASDMKGIIEALADQLPKFAAMAASIVEDRLKTFEEKVMQRFEDTKTSNAQAFADPDFQYLLGRSQHAYARSGDDNTADILVDLIAQRSLQNKRNRLTLSLNDAVEKSAYLTQNEFAELSLKFLIGYTITYGLRSFTMLCNHLKLNTESLISDISSEQSSYAYLEAQSCGSLGLGETRLMAILHENYGGLVSRGAEISAFDANLGGNSLENYPTIIVPCIHDGTKFQVNAQNKEELRKTLKSLGAEEKTDAIWNVHASGFMNVEQFIEAATPHFQDVGTLISAWDDTPLKNLQLTSVGIAIGFANLKRLSGFQADLATWIN